MKQQLRTIAAVAILLVTVGAFAYYLHQHPATLRQLIHLPPLTLLLLLMLYIVWFSALVLMTRGSLKLYGKTMGRQENMLFNAYSSLINFFGPGQSGPIFRGAYLKKRHGLGIKQYTFATLLYYGFYAVISMLMMLVGSRPWWQTAAGMAVVAVASWLVLRWYRRRTHIEAGAGFNLTNIGWIFAATLLQLAVQAVIYGIELHNAGAQASPEQVLAYTGVANFALFVALTPGAIGFRESFLLFSQHLHHIGSSTIVAANVVDRAVYLLFLGVLFALVLSLHAKDKLHLGQLQDNPGETHAAQR